MIRFNKPENLNGIELRQELINAGVQINSDPWAIRDNGEGSLFLDIPESDELLAASVVLAHNGTTTNPELTPLQKLESVGLSIEELKSALGLN